MNPNDIKKFNHYCSEVMGMGYHKYELPESYDPYNNLYQLAAVVEELINLTGKTPADDLNNTDTGTRRIWSNYVINNMLGEGLGPLESKLMLELATYEDGMVSKEQYIAQIIKVVEDHNAVKKVEPTTSKKIKDILIVSGYEFSESHDYLEKDNIDPFYTGFDETLELWAWRQTAALGNYFGQRPELWNLWNSFTPYVYDIGVTIDEWRQDRIKWCIERLDVKDIK